MVQVALSHSGVTHCERCAREVATVVAEGGVVRRSPWSPAFTRFNDDH